MHTYIHKVYYYETDKMGITHHSNYVRWMEEARMDFLQASGCGMRGIEACGLTSPVVELECRYLAPTTFDDVISIAVSVEGYTGVKLTLSYIMTNSATGAEVFRGRSSHCFINGAGRPVAIGKHHPALDALLRGQAGQ